MSQVIPLQKDRFEGIALRRIWAKLHGQKYAVMPSKIQEKGFDHPNFLPDLSFALVEGADLLAFLIAKDDPYGTLFGEPKLNRIHINSIAFGEYKQGEHLLNHFLAVAPKNRPIVFGQDQGHFFPGVPEECPNLLELLLSHGFEKQGDWANDLEHDLREFDPEPVWLEPLQASDLHVRPCTDQDIPALDEFLTREFPGRWHYDTVIEKCRTWHEPQGIVALWQNNTIEGFAYTQTLQTASHPTAGFSWCLNLGPRPGALGPIGVSQRVRGRKLGGALLVASLVHLKNLGVRRCIIDWTSLTDFYGKYGFRVNRRYQPVTRPASTE